MEDDDIEEKERLVYGILKRIVNFTEIRNDDRVDFDEFMGLLKKSMNMR